MNNTLDALTALTTSQGRAIANLTARLEHAEHHTARLQLSLDNINAHLDHEHRRLLALADQCLDLSLRCGHLETQLQKVR